jgi:hypothetical protein
MTVNTEHFRATANLDRIRTRPFTTHNFEFNSSLLLQIYQHYTFSFFFQINIVGPYFHIKCEFFERTTITSENLFKFHFIFMLTLGYA